MFPGTYAATDPDRAAVRSGLYVAAVNSHLAPPEVEIRLELL